MARKTSISRESLAELATKLAGLREKALTEDENTLLTLKIEGKTDTQVAAVFGISIPVTNQKKHKLFALIKGLSWWIDHRTKILTHLEEAAAQKRAHTETASVFDLVATRYTKNDVAAAEQLSAWKVTRAINFALAEFMNDIEFREFFESLRLGYKLPWKGGVSMSEETTTPEPEETVETPVTEETPATEESTETPATEETGDDSGSQPAETAEAPAEEATEELEFPATDAEEPAAETTETPEETEAAEETAAPTEKATAEETTAEEPVAEPKEDEEAF